MRQMSVENLHTAVLVEKLRSRITTVGRWHLKRRKADSTRIWKLLFTDLKELLNEREPFTKSAYITLIVYTRYNRYSFHIHKHNCSSYHGYVAKRNETYEEVITALNSVLIHYDLALIETSDSKKRNLNHNLNGQKEYEVKFVQKTIE